MTTVTYFLRECPFVPERDAYNGLDPVVEALFDTPHEVGKALVEWDYALSDSKLLVGALVEDGAHRDLTEEEKAVIEASVEAQTGGRVQKRGE